MKYIYIVFLLFILSAKSGDMQLWEIETNGANLHQVTNYEGGIGGFLYSPDGSKILFYKDVKLDKTINELYPDLPNTKARIIDGLMYRHWDSWEDESYSHVFFVKYNEGVLVGEPVDAMKDQRFEAPLQPMGGEEQFCWAPNSKSFIYTCKKSKGTEAAYSTNSDLFNYDIETGVTTNLTDGMVGYDQDPQYSHNGKKLFWLSMERAGYESDKSRLMCYDFELKQKTEISK
ncbi:MAG: PD40 domain-containing protein, partial [Bacteroidetes bacterium]|nr:PD40 domain-containing protein [Bacteroidota bacterium]